MHQPMCEDWVRVLVQGTSVPPRVRHPDSEEAQRWRTDLEAFERMLPSGPVSAGDRRKLHVRCPWARDLVEDPRLLDVMESLLGPDILVYTSTFFIKEPNT